jgi:hypothetical protein
VGEAFLDAVPVAESLATRSAESLGKSAASLLRPADPPDRPR